MKINPRVQIAHMVLSIALGVIAFFLFGRDLLLFFGVVLLVTSSAIWNNR